MIQFLVVALNTNNGYNIGGTGDACVGMTIPESAAIDWNHHNFGEDEDPIKQYKVFSCTGNNADIVANKVAKANPGMDVEVYQLTSIYIAPPSDVIKKVVTKEGILPF